ncbi:MAG: thioredoxin family protein [Chryseosolibacter sp.]
MKTVFLSILIFLSTPGVWLTDFDKARTIASQENKHILLNFSGSDWCGPCIKMTRDIFESAVFKSFAEDNLVLVRADFPRMRKNQLETSLQRHNEALAERYNPEGKFPLTLLLDENGKVIHEWDGYGNVTAEVFVERIQELAGK